MKITVTLNVPGIPIFAIFGLGIVFGIAASLPFSVVTALEMCAIAAGAFVAFRSYQRHVIESAAVTIAETK